MNEAKELRIGVCECTHAFEGVEGRQIELPGYSFKLVQVPVGRRRNQYPDIYRNRAHFLLETAPRMDNQGSNGVLFRINLYPSREGIREQVQPDRRKDQFKIWEKSTPSAQQVVKSISTILENLESRRLAVWLDHMTPAGWVMPQRPTALVASCDVSGSQPLFRGFGLWLKSHFGRGIN